LVYAWQWVDENRVDALEGLRADVERWRSGGLYPIMRHAGGGRDDELDHARLAGLTVAGSAEDCAEAVAQLARAGAGTVVLVPPLDRRDEQLERLAAEVLPRLADRRA
jgi:alkanesulfonate monooxygenase SsuD/methylene tetrahydromethanopterin reductase-like flavin-dependent oxidoreductase (luciferase family)